MYCERCGKFIESDSNLCDECASATNAAPAAPETAHNDFVPDGDTMFSAPAETYAPSAPAAPTYPASEDTFELNTPTTAAPKKGKGRTIALIVIAIVAVVGVLLFLFWDSIMGLFSGTPAPTDAQQYMRDIEKSALNSSIDGFCSTYGENLAVMKDSQNGTDLTLQSDMHLLLGEDILDAIGIAFEQEGLPSDVDWLSDILLSFTVTNNQSMSQVTYGFGLNDTAVLVLDLIMNNDTGAIWMGLPDFNKSYLHMDPAAMGMGVNSIMSGAAFNAEMFNALPSEEALRTLLPKYFGIVFDNLQNVTKDTQNVTANSFSKKMTVLTYTIYEKDALTIALKILEELEDDSLAQDVLANFLEYSYSLNPTYDYVYNSATGDYKLVPITPEIDGHEILMEGIESGIEELEEELEDCSTDDYLVITTYVGDNDEICGRKFTAYSNNREDGSFQYLLLRDGEEFYWEAKIDDVAFLTGTGTTVNDLTDATFVWTEERQPLFTLEVEDMDSNLYGSFRLVPSEALVEAILDGMDMDGASVISGMDLAIEGKITGDGQNEEIELRLMANNDLLFGFSISAVQKSADTVSVPKDTVDMTDQNALMQWASSMDGMKLLQKLSDAGIPMSFIESLVYLLMAPGQSGIY